MTMIRYNTAHTITLGPVLDDDGVAVTTEVVASIKASKNGGAPAALHASATLVHQHTGHYLLAMTTSDADMLGVLELSINSGVNAMPPVRLNVVPANVFDSLVLGGDYLDASMVQWLGVAPLALASQRVQTDVTALGSSAGALANLKAYNDGTRPVLYVSKSGDDANDGSGWGKAKLTIQAAVAAASGGERIRVAGPGTFDETVDLSSLAGIVLELLSEAVITQSSGYTVILGTACTIEGRGTLEQTGTSSTATAVLAFEKDNVCVKGLKIRSGREGILFNDCRRSSIENNRIDSGEYGIRLLGYTNCLVEGNLVDCSGWTACDSYSLFVRNEASCLCVKNAFTTTIANGDANHQAAGITTNSSAEIVLIDNYFKATVTSGSRAFGVRCSSSASRVIVIGGSCNASAPAMSYDLYAQDGIIYAKTQYVTSAVVAGTITDLDERAVQNILVDNNLDHLLKTATAAADMTTEMADNTVFARALAGGDTSSFIPGTHDLKKTAEAAVTVDELTEAGGDGDLADNLGYVHRLVSGKRRYYPAGTDITGGDLCYMATADNKVYPASSQADEGSETGNQELFAWNFVGVAEDTCTVATGVWCYQDKTLHTFSCPDDTYAVGQLVGVDENVPGNALLDQTVTKVNNHRYAIGRVAVAVTGTSVEVVPFGREESVDWEDGQRLDLLLDAIDGKDQAAGVAKGAWYVSKQGNDANDGRSWQTAKLTIPAAITAAATQDSIGVGPGTFVNAGYALNKWVHITGSGFETKWDLSSAAGGLDIQSGAGGGSICNMQLVNTLGKLTGSWTTPASSFYFRRCKFRTTGGSWIDLSVASVVEVNDSILNGLAMPNGLVTSADGAAINMVNDTCVGTTTGSFAKTSAGLIALWNNRNSVISGTYDLEQSGTGFILIARTNYNRAKVSGTISDCDELAAEYGVHDAATADHDIAGTFGKAITDIAENQGPDYFAF